MRLQTHLASNHLQTLSPAIFSDARGNNENSGRRIWRDGQEPSFVEDAQRADIEVSPVSGVELKSMFADFLNARAGVKKELALLVQ